VLVSKGGKPAAHPQRPARIVLLDVIRLHLDTLSLSATI
jgi:hypothetical protein